MMKVDCKRYGLIDEEGTFLHFSYLLSDSLSKIQFVPIVSTLEIQCGYRNIQPVLGYIGHLLIQHSDYIFSDLEEFRC